MFSMACSMFQLWVDRATLALCCGERRNQLSREKCRRWRNLRGGLLCKRLVTMTPEGNRRLSSTSCHQDNSTGRECLRRKIWPVCSLMRGAKEHDLWLVGLVSWSSTQCFSIQCYCTQKSRISIIMTCSGHLMLSFAQITHSSDEGKHHYYILFVLTTNNDSPNFCFTEPIPSVSQGKRWCKTLSPPSDGKGELHIPDQCYFRKETPDEPSEETNWK